MRKIAVIGSNSFSGQDFVDLLLEDKNNKVIGISRSPEIETWRGRYHNRGRDRFEFHRFDLNRDADWIQWLLDKERPEYIVNFAAQSEVGPSWAHPEHWFQTNTVGLINLVNPLREAKWLKKYIHISSPEVYGTCVGNVTEESPVNPTTPYAASKAAADMLLNTLVKNFDFPCVFVRATNVYGARQQLFKIIPKAIICHKKGEKLQLHGGGVAIKSFINVRDVSLGELAVLEKGEPGQMYHFSPDGGYSVREVVERICKRLGVKFDDLVEVVGERLGQDAAYVIDSSKARKAFGWEPKISLDEGIEETIEWVDKYWDLIKEQCHDYEHKV